jgi:hypothetical protein
MARPKAKCRQYIMLFFAVLITYLVGSLYYEFRFLDLGYLIVVIVGFVRFLKVKEGD